MKTKIILTEKQLEKLTKRIKTLNEDKFSVEPKVKRTPRERDIDKLFGSYTNYIPDDVIRYMRKNPRLIVRRLAKIYGIDKLMSYLKIQKNNYNGTIPKFSDLVKQGVPKPNKATFIEYFSDEFSFSIDITRFEEEDEYLVESGLYVDIYDSDDYYRTIEYFDTYHEALKQAELDYNEMMDIINMF
jgi:hypothetical protein